MFRWCSFCQHLIGETPPLNRYQVTHGICDRCAENLGTHDPPPSVLRAKALFDNLDTAAHIGDFEATGEAIDEALAAGLKPSEIMIGVLHPILGRVGDLWETGEMTVADEHRVTHFASQVIEERLCNRPPRRRKPLVLLAPYEESCHEIGLGMLQHLTWERDIACRRLPVGTSGEEISIAVEELQPQLVGLSVSLVDTIPRATSFARELARKLPPDSELVLGGAAFRQAEAPALPADLSVLTTADQYIERIGRLDKSTVASRISP